MQIPKGGVAFFDSGIGGLTVLDECKKRLKGELFYYYGDNAHAPYGNLPTEKIEALVFSAFEKLSALRPKAAVIGCNTATALCVEKLRQRFDFPIIGAEPAVLTAANRGGDVFVLTTKATFESERFQKLCARARVHYPQSNLRLFPCHQLAGVIEKNLFNERFDYTPYLPAGKPAAVVLGCTHYIYIKKYIEDFYRCKTFDGNAGIAARLCAVLKDCPPPQTDGVFFLGTQKNFNKKAFEQMFVPQRRFFG